VTTRLYYRDAYLTEFDAVVLERADDARRVYLDRTAFYPTSGWQPFDTGRLGDGEVVDVVDEGERIAHLLAAPLHGDRVRGQVDWPRRFDHMQQHTGQHVLSAVLAERFGHETVSVHFGRDSSTLDLGASSLSHGEVVEAELLANRAVTDNRSVTVDFEDAAAASGLRKPTGRAGTIRVVTIHELDRSACGGTHVRATGEIGAILIRKVERVKHQVRLEFLCGERAVRRARCEGDLLAELAATRSAAAEDLPALLAAERADLKAAVAARRDLEEALAGYRARDLYASATADPRGRRLAIVREPTGPVERLRAMAQAYASLPAAVFVGIVGQPPALLLAAASDTGLDAGKALKAALDAHGGRGGGNARMAQGTVKEGTLDAVVETILRD